MVNKVLCVYQSTETMTRDKITSNIILTLHLQSSKNILLNDASSNLHFVSVYSTRQRLFTEPGPKERLLFWKPQPHSCRTQSVSLHEA